MITFFTLYSFKNMNFPLRDYRLKAYFNLLLRYFRVLILFYIEESLGFYRTEMFRLYFVGK